MRVFLIDFENVRSEGMMGVDVLGEDDEVVIFYSENAATLSFELLHKIEFSKAERRYFKIRRGGRNALDFQLSSYLGFLISSAPKNEFYIISKDHGFDFIFDFWESGCINIEQPFIRRYVSIKSFLSESSKNVKSSPKVLKPAPLLEVETLPENNELTENPENPENPENRISPEKAEVLTEEVSSPTKTDVLAEDEIDEETINRLLSASQSTHSLYIASVKKFGQKKGVEVYRSIKSRFFAEKSNPAG